MASRVSLLRGIEVQKRYTSEDAVVVEVAISGHHLGVWRGLPPTGRPVRFPLCGIFVFDHDDRLAGEKIYYDRATVLRQLGIFHEPDSVSGRIVTMLTHPLTTAQAVWRMESPRDHKSSERRKRRNPAGALVDQVLT